MHTISESEVLPLGIESISVENMHLSQPMCAHSHDFSGLGFVRSGRGIQRTERGSIELHSGSLVVMGPGTWHAYEPRNTLTISNLYIGGDLLAAELSWLSRLPKIGRILVPPRIDDNRPVLTLHLGVDVLRAVCPPLDALANSEADNIFRRLSLLFDVLSSVTPLVTSLEEVGGPMFRCSAPGVHLSGGSILVGGKHPAVEHAMTLLHDHIDEPWTLTDLATQVCLSASQLVRLFNIDAGVSPMAYLQRTRAERFAYLLRSTDLAVSAAGRAVGWHDAAYAARRFRAHWHTSPTDYRARFVASPTQPRRRRVSRAVGKPSASG